MSEEREIDATLYPFINAYTHFVKVPEREIVGRGKETRLILSAFCRPELSNVLLLGDAGSGKALLNSTQILTSKGFKDFGSLTVGTTVYDNKGFPTIVTGVFPQGKKRVYKVIFSDDSVVYCNDEHIWSVRTKEVALRDGPYENMTLRQILDSGKGTKYVWYIPNNSPPMSTGKKFMPMLYKDLMKAVGSNDIQKQFEIFREVLTLSVKRREAFFDYIKGIYKHNERNSFKFKEYMLASVFIELANSLGKRCNLVYLDFVDGGTFFVDLIVYDDFKLINNSLAIKGIIDMGYEDEMTCITVDSKSKLFQVTHNFIVTHNTALLQSTSMKDPNRLYLEVDLAKMLTELSNECFRLFYK